MSVISATSVSKQYRVRRDGPVTVKELLLARVGRGPRHAPGHWALRDVSFRVGAGRAFGVIGHNGAGKSTLLRLMCGLGRPTSGRIDRVPGVAGLLELGSGFHPDLTGRENIAVGGVLSGFTRREMKAKEEEIVAFAELEDFIDLPMRTYSSGMALRLAFATAVHSEPDVLVVDEVLAVGDARFQAKCLERLRTFRQAGHTLVLASHVSEQISGLCEEVLVLEEGRVAMQGTPEDALRCYDELMQERTQRRAAQIGSAAAAPLQVGQGSRHGTQEASVSSLSFHGAHGESIASLRSGEALTIDLHYTLGAVAGDVAMSVGIFRDATKCFEVVLSSAAAVLGTLAERGTISCRLPAVPLLPGRYFVNVGLYPTNWDYVYDYHYQMHELEVTGPSPAHHDVSGVAAMDPAWSTAAAGDATI